MYNLYYRRIADAQTVMSTVEVSKYTNKLQQTTNWRITYLKIIIVVADKAFQNYVTYAKSVIIILMIRLHFINNTTIRTLDSVGRYIPSFTLHVSQLTNLHEKPAAVIKISSTHHKFTVLMLKYEFLNIFLSLLIKTEKLRPHYANTVCRIRWNKTAPYRLLTQIIFGFFYL